MLFAGCQARRARGPILRSGEHIVRVNATAAAPLQKGTAFVVTPAKDPAAEATLLYAEAAKLVKGALMARGLYEAPGAAHAAVIVEIEYGMATARVERPGARDASAPPAATVVNQRTLVGEDATQLRSAERGPLEKTLVLTAREAKPKDGGPPRTLWSVELATTDDSNDLRKYLPLLAATAIDQIGTDTGGPHSVKVDEKDKTVALLKQSK
jgi:hypothetical protein